MKQKGNWLQNLNTTCYTKYEEPSYYGFDPNVLETKERMIPLSELSPPAPLPKRPKDQNPKSKTKILTQDCSSIPAHPIIAQTLMVRDM